MAFDLIFKGALEITERVQVLDLGFCTEALVAPPAHADVRIAAKRAFFHIAIADVSVLEHLFQRAQIRIGLGRGTQVRFGDDFRERHAAAVVIDIAVAIRVRKALVDILCGVFLEMQPRDADFFRRPIMLEFQPPVRGQRQFVHGNLITLGQVGIKIILSRKARILLDAQIERQRGAQGQLQSALIEHRQGAGQAEADRAGVGVRRIAESRGAGAEDFGRSLQLHVDFEPDDGLVSRGDFRRDSRDCRRGSGHGEFRDYNIPDSAILDRPTTRDRGPVGWRTTGERRCWFLPFFLGP